MCVCGRHSHSHPSVTRALSVQQRREAEHAGDVRRGRGEAVTAAIRVKSSVI